MRTTRRLIACYAAIILVGIVVALPNLFTPQQLSRLPAWVPKQQITLGLDLRGGSHLVLEVDEPALVKERLDTLADEARVALAEAKISGATVRVSGDHVVVDVADPGRHRGAAAALRTLVAPPAGATAMSGAEAAVTVAGDGHFRLELTDAGVRERLDAAVAQSIEIVRHRIDQIGVAEPTVQRLGADRILVQLPGVQDPARIRALLGSTAKMSFHLLAPGAEPAGRVPPGVSLLPDADGRTFYPVLNRIALAGDRLTDARAGFDHQTGEPVVTFRFDSFGARTFADVTRANVGRPFAIVMDGKVLSAPVIREPITGGSGQISGRFSVEDTTVLSALLRAGALPVPMTVIEERSVGPDLGSDAIQMGLATGLAGFALVFAFMVLLYGWWGLIANLALALNVVLTFAALSLLGATLTLPGIAGIILGIGLAVDANVLINERIREETRKGMSAFSALQAGFKRAYATIVDSNVTALIATLLLFLFGSGPVQGFAVTMALGIGFSMFTAVSVVRVIMTEVVRRRRLQALRIEPLVRLVPDGTRIPFMKARFAGIGISILISLASLGLFFSPGLNYGVDFRGGIQMEVATSKPADLAAFRGALSGLDLGDVALQEIGNDDHLLIRVERQAGGDKAQALAVQQMAAAVAEVDSGASIERTEVVGPKISGELTRSGIVAVVLASLAMLVYIWLRFEWHFAVGAIATLVLDVTKTVGFFALVGLDFNLTAIAALLTLIGYSVNDKVVVYDRMRENMRLFKAATLREIVDKSINQTLARSLYTSLTAFLAMLPMAIWGGGAVASFALPMLFGIVVAASSSVFIAAPILLFLGDWRQRAQSEPPDAVPSTRLSP